MKICPKCNESHVKSGMFCSRSCANSRGPRPTEFKLLVSQKLTGRIGHSKSKGKRLVQYETRSCPKCEAEFEVSISSNKKFCDAACAKGSTGGYREGSGRAKTGYYKGIYCGSTYELVWVIYQLDHSNDFTRFSGFLEKNSIKYYPDFLIGNEIIEIKGYEKQESVDQKTAVAESFGYTVSVLRKDQLAIHFAWVKEHYEYKELFELYDGYKPKYNLICSQCGTKFARNSMPKTKTTFCSRQCAGKGHTGRKIIVPIV
jgi:hypothetical protein